MNLWALTRILGEVLDVPYELLVLSPSAAPASVDSALRWHVLPKADVTAALRYGVEQARGEYILIFAADEVGPVLALHDMLALAQAGCEFVSCTRYAHGGRRLGGSWLAGALSRAANRAFRVLSGSVFSDATTGIKLFPKALFERLNPQAGSAGWAVAFELAIKAQALGCTCGEVPIISIDRLYGGQPTFQVGTWTREYLRWFVWGVWHLRTSRAPRPSLQVSIPTPASLLGESA